MAIESIPQARGSIRVYHQKQTPSTSSDKLPFPKNPNPDTKVKNATSKKSTPKKSSHSKRHSDTYLDEEFGNSSSSTAQPKNNTTHKNDSNYSDGDFDNISPGSNVSGKQSPSDKRTPKFNSQKSFSAKLSHNIDVFNNRVYSCTEVFMNGSQAWDEYFKKHESETFAGKWWARNPLGIQWEEFHVLGAELNAARRQLAFARSKKYQTESGDIGNDTITHGADGDTRANGQKSGISNGSGQSHSHFANKRQNTLELPSFAELDFEIGEKEAKKRQLIQGNGGVF